MFVVTHWDLLYNSTGTVGKFVSTVQWVKLVSVVSPVSLSVSVSLSAEMSSSYEHASKSDSNIRSMMSWSVRFLLVAIPLNTLQPESAHTKSNTF